MEPTAHRGPSNHNPISFAISQLAPEPGTTAPRLKRPLMEAAGDKHNRLIVDLTNLTFIDSTALRMLVDANKMRTQDDPMVVVCANSKVLRIFKISGLEASFQMFSSLDEALGRAPRVEIRPLTQEGLQRI
jgi:anti-sigma B factor antagonist